MQDIAKLARDAQASAQATAPAQARESAYEDVTDPVPSGDARGECLVTRKKSTGVMYVTFRSARGRDSRYPLAHLGTLGFVHTGDTDALKDAGFVPAPAPKSKPESKTPASK